MKNQTKMNKLLSTMAALGLVMSSNAAYSAPNGNYGNNSNASAAISLTIPSRVRITGLDDMTFDMSGYGGTGDLTVAEGVCIYANTPTFGINAESAQGTAAGDFELDSAGTKLTYSVDFSGNALTEGTTTTGLSGHSTTSVVCSNTDSHTVTLTIAEADLIAAPQSATAYTDTLTITVSPG